MGDAAAGRLRDRATVPLIFIAGLAHNLALLLLWYRPAWKRPHGDERYYLPRIQDIAAGSDVVQDPLWPPMYIDVFGWLTRGVGYHPAVIHLVQVALFMISGWWFYRIAEQVIPSRVAVVTCLVLYFFVPEFAVYTSFPVAEVLHLFFVVGALWLLVCNRGRLIAVGAAGVLLGLALMTKSVLFYFVPVIAAGVALHTTGGWGRRTGHAALLLGVVLIALVPAMLRNRAIHGTYGIAGSGPLNVWIGINMPPRPDYDAERFIRGELDSYQLSAPDHAGRLALYQQKASERIREIGVLPLLEQQLTTQYFRLFHSVGKFTAQLPDGPQPTYSLTDLRLSSAIRGYAGLWYAGLLFCAAIGIACFRVWRRPGWLHVFLAFLLYNLAVFLLVVAQTRYRYVMLPFMMLFAGAALHWAFGRLRGTRSPALEGFRFTRVRLATGVGLGLLLEYLAFSTAWWVRG